MDAKQFMKKLICLIRGHSFLKENTELDTMNGMVRLHEFETDYRNKCCRCGKIIRWTVTPYGSWSK